MESDRYCPHKTFLSVGNGNKIRFWLYRRIDNIPLFERFPWIFAISTLKHRVVADFEDSSPQPGRKLYLRGPLETRDGGS